MSLTVIAGGRVVTPAGVVAGDVLVDGERIVAVAESGRFDGDRIDARECFVLPGGVDPHVHLLSDVPAGDQALLGGTTTALSFTWPEDGEDPIAAFERARDVMLPDTSLDVALHAALWTPEQVTAEHVRRLAELGVCGLKLYVAYPELGMMASDRVVYDVMRWATDHRLPVQVHCENGDLIAALTAEALAAGRTGVREFFHTRPVIAEEEAVHRMLCLSEVAGAELYLVHLSTAGAVDHVRAARRRGVRVTAESCTWNLMLDDSVIAADDPTPYMAAPPPRPREHVEAVWRAVADGTVSSLGSDHHERTYAPPAAADFTGIGYSIRGLRVRLPMLLAEGLRRGIAIERMSDLLAAGPARAFGIASKGRLAPGADADVVVWDPSANWAIGDDYPAWRGTTVAGAVRTVLRRGEVVVRDGELLQSRTPGRHLPRATPGAEPAAIAVA
ncbi:MAG TPA: amidohydrolase family protein [Solirubrobacteraceae bacterium]|nr:amidohydrolase family protein [Solirubrobacteraceae bacterium]